VEGVVQETLLKAHKNHQQFHGTTEAELTAWLQSILANTMTDAVRRSSGDGSDVEREVSLEAVEQSPARLEALLRKREGSSVALPSSRPVHNGLFRLPNAR
jgi:DNA-directed RNA polymerase specialized sigma24 family protein